MDKPLYSHLKSVVDNVITPPLWGPVFLISICMWLTAFWLSGLLSGKNFFGMGVFLVLSYLVIEILVTPLLGWLIAPDYRPTPNHHPDLQ